MAQNFVHKYVYTGINICIFIYMCIYKNVNGQNHGQFKKEKVRLREEKIN